MYTALKAGCLKAWTRTATATATVRQIEECDDGDCAAKLALTSFEANSPSLVEQEKIGILKIDDCTQRPTISSGSASSIHAHFTSITNTFVPLIRVALFPPSPLYNPPSFPLFVSPPRFFLTTTISTHLYLNFPFPRSHSHACFLRCSSLSRRSHSCSGYNRKRVPFSTKLSLTRILTLSPLSQIQVQVGSEASSPGGVFQFIPNQINATVGSTITFNFTGTPGNHSVTQSTAADPCNPLSGGFSSGFVFIPAGTTGETPTWNLTLESADRTLKSILSHLLPPLNCCVIFAQPFGSSALRGRLAPIVTME